MPFDMGFNFRATAGYVTDQAYAVPVLAETYPNTYTNANGNSINAGWDGGVNTLDRSNTNDPRLAGVNYLPSASQRIFQVDLSSGSNPGAGSYTIDIAAGDQGNNLVEDFKILDNATLLIDGTNGGSGFTPAAAGHFIDVTLTDVTASVNWTGTTVSKTFASTTAYLVNNPDLLTAPVASMAHFRLTLATAKNRAGSMTLLGVGA